MSPDLEKLRQDLVRAEIRNTLEMMAGQVKLIGEAIAKAQAANERLRAKIRERQAELASGRGVQASIGKPDTEGLPAP